MTFDLGLTLFLLLAAVAVLALNLASADFTLLAVVSVLVLAGVLPVQDALRGFSNEGMLTVAVLFIVSGAVERGGGLEYFVGRFLGYPHRRTPLSLLLAKMMVPIAALSAFINNTPIVALFTPVIKKWSERGGLPASKFLIPLSYAAILGGTCTLIGTSTNLLSHGLMIESGFKGLSLFELAWVGIPCAAAGLLYLALVGKRLLPERKDVASQVIENPKEYVIELKVTPGSPLAGSTIREAGLRNLRGVYLLDIEREGRSLGPVSARERILAQDRLVFVGVPSAVLELQEIPGLVPAAHQMFEEDFARMRAHFAEAVVSATSPILGKTVKECDFRKRYGAGVIAVHRNGERIREKVGGIKLRAGDTLLLFTGEDFLDRWINSQDFYLVSHLRDFLPRPPQKSLLAIGIMMLMIAAAAIGESLPLWGLPGFGVLEASLAAVLLLFATGCMRGREARNSIQWDILVVIALAIALSKALQTSGVADWLAQGIREGAGRFGPHGALALVYFMTVLITEVLTNNAAVALAFPIAVATASQLGADPRPFMIAVTLGASNGFASPLGYQTHLMVQGPGGYRFADYLRVGLPLDFLVGAVAVWIIPLHWPF